MKKDGFSPFGAGYSNMTMQFSFSDITCSVGVQLTAGATCPPSGKGWKVDVVGLRTF